MDSFEFQLDSMKKSYQKLEALMGDIHKELENSQDKETLYAILKELGSIGESILDSELGFVDSYCSDDYKDYYIDNITDKKNVLTNALQQENNRTI